MSLEGKGFFIWKVPNCEGGNPSAIAAAAKAAGFTHVLLKIADGTYAYNLDKTTKTDLLPPVVQALRSNGLKVWGWHYVYGSNPIGEANMAIQRLQELELEGYVIDAEIEYKQPGRAAVAKRFMEKLRASLPGLPMALSSYRFPSFHRQLPWSVFLEYVDYNMPQVYWEQNHNAEANLRRCLREFQAMQPFRPIFPTGPAYKTGGWRPTPADTIEFLNTARELQLKGANFFSWDECRRDVPEIWETVAGYQWNAPLPVSDISDLLLAALNSHDLDKIVSLYLPDAVHITFARAIQGSQAIRTWYNTLFHQTLPSASFKITGVTGTGNSRHISWTATSSRGNITNGSDSIGLLDGKIAYHYSNFSINA